ncbi:MAG: STAS domain-containing protein [Bdellovibrionia bacterium]
MKTEIKKNGDTIIVNMDGLLDFDTYLPLREDLSKLTRNENTDSVPRKIIFNLENLEFVGSSGISSFVQTLKEFNASATTKPRYCNVKSEFRRIIKAFDETELFQIYENEDRARKSFDS